VTGIPQRCDWCFEEGNPCFGVFGMIIYNMGSQFLHAGFILISREVLAESISSDIPMSLAGETWVNISLGISSHK
jgi:hypothetical protein